MRMDFDGEDAPLVEVPAVSTARPVVGLRPGTSGTGLSFLLPQEVLGGDFDVTVLSFTADPGCNERYRDHVATQTEDVSRRVFLQRAMVGRITCCSLVPQHSSACRATAPR